MWTIEALARSRVFAGIVVAAPAGWTARVRALAAGVRPRVPVRVVRGGRDRQGSVLACLRALPDACDLVAVHDAARPLVPPAVVRRTVAAARRTGAALAACPLADTVKEVGAGGYVLRTVPRERLWSAQTPQAVRRGLLERAYRHARARGTTATDEAGLLERIGVRVRVVAGDPGNFKITRRGDLARAESAVRVAR